MIPDCLTPMGRESERPPAAGIEKANLPAARADCLRPFPELFHPRYRGDPNRE